MGEERNGYKKIEGVLSMAEQKGELEGTEKKGKGKRKKTEKEEARKFLMQSRKYEGKERRPEET